MFNRHLINRKNIISTSLIIIMLYFSFYFLFGKYGFINHSHTKRERLVKEETLISLEKENAELQNKISSFDDANINKDLLEEQVRKNLGYVEEDEIVIYYK